MIDYKNLINTINEDFGNVSNEFEESLRYHTDFFFWIFAMYPLLGITMWLILINRILIGMFLLMGIYIVPMLSFFKFAKANKKRMELLKEYWLPSTQCLVFKPKKIRYAVIFGSAIMAVELFVISITTLGTSPFHAIILAFIAVIIGPMFLVMDKFNCTNGLAFTHIVETISITTLGHMLAKEFGLDTKISTNTSFVKMRIPETQQLLTLSKPERNKTRIYVVINPVNTTNVYATKQIISKIERIIGGFTE
ncbi:MAG: hypothetical protein GXO25_05250 [Euryarchaeota archaeon]|nr:hypothetical protein [Euryarchaeota archaeon]